MTLQPISFRTLKREAPEFARGVKDVSRVTGIPVPAIDIFRDGDDYLVVLPERETLPGTSRESSPPHDFSQFAGTGETGISSETKK